MIRKIYIFFILIIVLNIFCISTAEFTGLIIDCRDLNEQLTISILPKIITKNGKLVYGTKKVPKKIIIEKKNILVGSYLKNNYTFSKFSNCPNPSPIF